MADQVRTSTSVATKWALINLVVGIVLTYVYEFLDITQESPARYLSLLPFIAFLFLAQKEYKEVLGGYITFGQAFSTGFRFALFAGLLTALFVYIYTKFLNVGAYEASMTKAENDMIEKGMEQDQIDTAMGFARSWGHVMGAFFAAVFTTILGLVFSVIGAAIFKKERSPYDNDTTAVADTDPAV